MTHWGHTPPHAAPVPREYPNSTPDLQVSRLHTIEDVQEYIRGAQQHGDEARRQAGNRRLAELQKQRARK